MGNIHGGDSSDSYGGASFDAYAAILKKALDSIRDQVKKDISSQAGDMVTGVVQAATNLPDEIGNAVDSLTGEFTFGGACPEPKLGGYKALADYSRSVFSQEKEKLIRGIASDVSSILKVKGDFANSASIESVVEKLQSIVPDPRKGKNFVKDAAIQSRVCKAFADSINKRYGSNVIDASADPAVICQAIGELMYSLFTGLHTEFLTVSSDIGKIVTNLKALRDYVDASNRRLRDLVNESGSSSQKNQADSAYVIYEKLRNEIDRQLAILTNIVNSTTSPLGKNLVALIEHNNEFKGLIQDLRVSTGSEAFGDKLGYLLSGVGSVSHAAQIIDKALKDLGMTVRDYTNTSSLADFREKVYEHMSKNKLSSAELRKMLEAADIIYRTDYDHDHIVKHLTNNMSKTRGGVGSLDDDVYDLEEATEKEMGLARGYVSRKSLGLQMKETQHFRQLLFKDLKTILRHNFQKIVDSVNNISRDLGSDIPITDDLYKFVVRFGQIESPDRENLHMALSGYRKDVASRHIKNTFMASLRAVHATLEPLKSGSGGSKFKEIQDAFGTLIRSVDDFSDKFVKSLTEIPVDITKTSRGGYEAGDLAGSPLGGAEQEMRNVIGSASSPGDFDYFTSIQKVQKELNYYYSIANLRGNLNKSSAELESYGQDYENILGDEIAALVDQVNTDFNRDIDLADYTAYSQLKSPDSDRSIDPNRSREFEEQRALGFLLHKASQESSSIFGKNPSLAKEVSDTYRYVRTYQKTAKIGLLKAAEALDIYMKNFTTSVVAHPDDIRELSTMLGQVTIVAKWFTNRTGDHLASLFESWPSDIKKGIPEWSNGQISHPGDSMYRDIISVNHYYEWVKNKKGLGNPSIPWYPINGRTEVRDTFRRVEKSYTGMRALENLISTFSSLGDKFGGQSIKNSSFMSHKQMYKAISDYLVASSVSMGATGTTLANRELLSLIKVLNESDVVSGATGSSMKKTAARAAAIILVLLTVLAVGYSRSGGYSAEDIYGGAKFASFEEASTAYERLRQGDVEQGATEAALVEALKEVNAMLLKEGNQKVYPIPDTRVGFLGLAQMAKVDALPAYGEVPRVVPTPELADEAALAEVPVASKVPVAPGLPHAYALPPRRGEDGDGPGGWRPGLGTLAKAAMAMSVLYAAQRLWKYSEEISGGGVGIADIMRVMRNPAEAFGKALEFALSNKKVLDALSVKKVTVQEVFGNVKGVDPNEELSFEGILKLFSSIKDKSSSVAISKATANFMKYLSSRVSGLLDALPEVDGIREAQNTLEQLVPSSGVLGVKGGDWNTTHSKVSYPLSWMGKTATSEALDRIALTLRSVDNVGYNDDFSDTDHILQLMMKSMACKILTVVGVYNLFNRPGAINRSITPLRMILGAGVRGGAAPVVIDEAVELYIRLPLLAEWYREKFGFKKTGDSSSDYMVSMVPSFDGIWSDFVRIIFVETDYIRDGSYTDMNLQKLIAVINEIYKKYSAKYPKSTVREVINAFVTEINRRYGFVKKNEINEYFDSTREHLVSHGPDAYPDEDRVDYDILDSDQDYGRKPAPSDRFQKVSPGPKSSHRFAEKEQLMLAAIQFRERVELEMMDLSASFDKNLQDRTLGDNKYSFIENINQVTQKLRNAKNGDDRYEIVRDTIQGINKFAGISYEKTLMFNEVVITPITVLNSVYGLLNSFCCFAHGSNTWLLGKVAQTVAESGGKIILDNDPNKPDGFTARVKSEIKKKYPMIQDERALSLAGVMWKYANHDGDWLDIEENKNVTALQKGTALAQKAWAPINQQAFRRFSINRKALMKDLINFVFHMGCDLNGLVECRVSASGAPIVEYSKLQDLAVTLFNQAKSAIGEFRSVVSNATISKYESTGGGAGANYQGSLLWIEENLIETLFNNRDKAGMPEVNESLASSWTDLTRPWEFDATSFVDPKKMNGPNKDSFNDVFADLIYWNHKTDNAKAIRSNPSANTFPSMYVPYFKSGAFEPSSYEEKLAYAQLSKVPSVSADVLAAERNYHNEKYADMLVISPIALVPIGLPGWAGDNIISKAVDVSGALSMAHVMSMFIKWFVSVGYSTLVFGNVGSRLHQAAAGKNNRENFITSISARLNQIGSGISADPFVAPVNTRVINFQAVASVLPEAPGVDRDGPNMLAAWMGPGPARVVANQVLLAAGKLAAQGIARKARINIDSLFPAASLALNQLSILGVMFFGLGTSPDFEGYKNNIYGAKLHAVARRMADWFLQAVPQAPADLAPVVAPGAVALVIPDQSYQIRDGSGGRGSTMSIFLDWQKELDDISMGYMEELKKIDQNLVKAQAISKNITEMQLVRSYSKWYMNDPENLDKWDKTNQTGLIPVFNELLAKYIVGFGDRSQYARIYLPLIDAFANGSNSREIMQGEGIKDMNFSPAFITAHSTKGVKGDPPENVILYASLGRVIKSIITRTAAPMQTRCHIISNFVEVPDFVKESMRANLPVIDKEFEYISKKAQFLKSLIEAGHETEAGGVSIRRTIGKGLATDIANLQADYQAEYGLHGGMIQPTTQLHDARRPYLVSLLNSIVSGCASIQRCTETVQKELSDVPLYGEVFEGSIKQFRSKNSVNPLTPVSSMMGLLNQSYSGHDCLTPAFSVGSSKFKNLYSTRLVLAQSKVDPKMDYTPGFKDIIDKYNSVSDRTTQAPAYYGSIFHQIIQLTRYITDITYHKAIMGDFPVTQSVPRADGNQVMQYHATLSDIMGMFENNDVKRVALDITKGIASAEGQRGEDRKTLRIYNILDLNIVPINVHAMQREVPLIHLYNYSYTFDRMIQESLIPDWRALTNQKSNVRLVIKHNSQVSTTKGMLAKCLMFPHGERSEAEYYGPIRRLMVGSTGLNIGRPKYLSDQLWGKVLLQDIFPYDAEPDEAGPSSELSLLRGTQGEKFRRDKKSAEARWLNPQMSYIHQSKVTKIKIDDKVAAHVANLGQIRYKTHVVRNQEWFTNLQLYVRYLMRESLKWIDTPVVRGNNVLNESVTSYDANDEYTSLDFQ